MLDEATGKWGIRVNRVELKGIDPPPSIKDSMEKQMRADRDKRAVILTAEGQRQSAILTAEGNKQSAILTAEGDRESLILRAQADREAAILRAQGEGQAIQTVFQAIHDGQPDQSLLAYQYLQMMPKIAAGDANKVWVIPSEITKALEGLGSSVHEIAGIPQKVDGPLKRVDMGPTEPAVMGGSGALDRELSKANKAVEDAIAEAERSANPGRNHEADLPPVVPEDEPGAHLADDGTTGDAARPVTLLQMVAVLLAGLAAGTINTVVGSGTLITFPTLLAFGDPAGHRQRVQHDRAGARGRLRGRTATGASWWASARGSCGSASPSLVGGLVGAVLLLVAAVGGVRRDRAGADRASGCCWSSSSRGSRAWVDARHEGGARLSRGRGGCGRRVAVSGVYGGYFGAAQGVHLMGILGHRHRRLVAAAERAQERAGRARQRHRRRSLFIFVAHVDWTVVGLIAVGSVIGGQLGATVGRRLSPLALRVFIVVVGLVALAVFLLR